MDFLSFLTPRSTLLVLIVTVLGMGVVGYTLTTEAEQPDLPIVDDIEKTVIDKPKDIVSTKPKPKPKPEPKKAVVVLKPKPKPKLTAKPKPTPKRDPRIVFLETFNEYEEGDAIPNWGPDLVVMGKNDKYLHSNIEGPKVVGKWINFPNEFSFSMTIRYIRGKYFYRSTTLNPRFIDDNGDVFLVNLRPEGGNRLNSWYVGMPRTKEVRVSVKSQKSNYFFRLNYKNGVMKTYMDDELIMAQSYPDLGPFVEFQVYLTPGVFTYSQFEIKHLGPPEEVSTKRFEVVTLRELVNMQKSKEGLQSSQAKSRTITTIPTRNKLLERSYRPTQDTYPLDVSDWYNSKHKDLQKAYDLVCSKIFSYYRGDKTEQEDLQRRAMSEIDKFKYFRPARGGYSTFNRVDPNRRGYNLYSRPERVAGAVLRLIGIRLRAGDKL